LLLAAACHTQQRLGCLWKWREEYESSSRMFSHSDVMDFLHKRMMHTLIIILLPRRGRRLLLFIALATSKAHTQMGIRIALFCGKRKKLSRLITKSAFVSLSPFRIAQPNRSCPSTRSINYFSSGVIETTAQSDNIIQLSASDDKNSKSSIKLLPI